MQNKNFSEVSWKTIFGVVAVWFGAHVGGGFATGNQTRTFFVQYGFTSIFMPFLIVALIGWVFYEGLLFAKNTNSYNYHNWIANLYGPLGGFGGYLFDIAYLLLTIVAVGASIAGGASLFENLFELKYIIGVLITGGIFFVLTIFGADLVRKSSAIITILLLVFLTMITFVGISKGSSDLSTIISTKQTTAPMSTILYNSLKYAGFQSLVIAIMLGAGQPLSTDKSVKRFAVLGIIINGIMITLSCLMMLAWLPLIDGETLPILTIIKEFDSEILVWVYSITLFLAFVSTGVGCIFGIVARYENSFQTFHITKRRMLISLLGMIISMLISLLGLNTLVIKGYGYLGVLSIFFLIIPTIVIGRIKNSKFKRGINSTSEVEK